MKRIDTGRVKQWLFQKRGWWNVLAALLIVAPLGLHAWLIYRYGVNVPYRDDWNFAAFARRVAEGGAWWLNLFDQYNENRFFVARLIIAGNVWLTGWNLTAQMYLGVVFSALSLGGLWLIYRRTGHRELWGFVPVAWLFVNFNQYQNYLFGIQLSFLCMVTGIIWMCYVLTLRTGRAFGLAMGLALFSAYSAASGLFAWIAGLGQLIGEKTPARRVVLWAVVAAGAYGLYLYGYNPRRSSNSLLRSLQNPGEMAQYFFTLLGGPYGGHEIAPSQVAGLVLLLAGLLCVGLMVRRRRRPPVNEWGALGLALFAFVTTVFITVGRAYLDPSQALIPRYITMTVLGGIGMYVWLTRELEGSKWAWALNVIIVPGLLILGVANDLASLSGAVQWSRNQGRFNMFVLQTQDVESKRAQDNLVAAAWLKRLVVENAPHLQADRLTFFRDPVRWWLMLRNPKPAVRIGLGAGAPATETFRCPVETLYDVGVPLLIPKGAEAAEVTLTLSAEETGQMLATRTVNTVGLRDRVPIFIKLPRAVEHCEGRMLRMEIASSAAAGEGAPAILTGPVLYEGTLAQGGEVIADASLGMELNAQYFDITDGQ